MRGSGNFLRTSAALRCWAGVALRVCFIATLLFSLAASAQDETPPETTPADEAAKSPADAAVESATDTASEVQESSAETDEPSGQELENLASETEEPFEIEPIQSSDIEEILIQGQAGTGIPKAAPISVIGFDMDTLSKEGIKDIRDLTNFTPSLEIKSQFASSNPAIFIRGVGLDDFNANAASAVAIYQDGVYMQSAAIQLFGFFDQERVEVLRGPQGTFYRNASAGAILVKSRPPTEEFETYIATTYGRFNQLDVTGAASGPIVPDWLSGRISGYYNSRDGITKNRCAEIQGIKKPCRDSPLFLERKVEGHVNDIENYGLRAQLLLAPPTLDMEWLVNVHGGQNLGHAYQYQHHAIHLLLGSAGDLKAPEVQLPIFPPYRPGDITGYKDRDDDPFAGDYDLNGPEDLDIFGAILKYTWFFGDSYEIESITGYEWHDRDTLENSDGGPRFALVTQYLDDAWQLSEELNLRGEWIGSDLGDGGWSVGAFYLQEDLNVENIFEIVTGRDLNQSYEQTLNNFGTYIQGDYTIRPGCAPIGCDVKLDLGLRYNIEHKKFDISTCTWFQSRCSVADVTLAGIESETWNGWSGDFILSWFYDDQESNVYLKYSRGWKGGHFNGGATSRDDIITAVEPEIVDSYELGLRAHWFDGRLMTNVTGFYYDYQDLQVFKLEQTPTQGFPIAKLVNAQSATVFGVELDLSASPVEGMNITFNFAWVESEYDEFRTTLPFDFSMERPGGRGGFNRVTIRVPFDYSGNTLIASPEFSFTGSINYQIVLPGQIAGRGLGTLTPRYSFSWKDDVFFDAGSGTGAYLNFPVATFGQEAFWIHNAALSWRSENELIEITGWVHNFLDEFYKTNSEDVSIGLSYILNSWADPRMYGITVTISY
ncbi:MAG: TonB-dependent receptor [Myxococcales bacterium]|nr:TonB-dependent receptor [Myxococcales bacterium]